MKKETGIFNRYLYSKTDPMVIPFPNPIPESIDDEAPLKVALQPRKVMVTVWWTSVGVVHFVNPGGTITVESYCAQLEAVLVNRQGLFLNTLN